MKTIKIKYFLVAVSILTLGACTKDFLELQPKGQFLSGNFYTNETECTGALVGVYDQIRMNTAGFDNMVAMLNAGSDDQYSGGGDSNDGAGIHAFSSHSLTSTKIPTSFWNDHFQGIYRANVLISKLPAATMSDALKSRFVAECKTLRAVYYFNLVRMFKNVPLFTEPVAPDSMYDVLQATPAAVYAQIEKDLNDAIPNLPTTLNAVTESGRLTRGAAQAMLGKVYLFDGKKTEAAAVLAQVNGTPGQANQYGNKLLTNYSDLWVVSNKFNSESLLEVSHSNQKNAWWGINWGGQDEGNALNVMVGVRGYNRKDSSTPDLAPGWSFNIFTQDLYDFMKNDPRFGATIMDLKALETAGKIEYSHGDQDTGYYLNKYLPRKANINSGGGNWELNFRQNSYIIRLADTYLMEAEALGSGARAQALLDAVRARVGLPSVPVTLAAIKDERRKEFAGEGLRFFDLVRWGDAAAKLANRGFVAGKDEIFPIPQVELQGTKLVQNPGYN